MATKKKKTQDPLKQIGLASLGFAVLTKQEIEKFTEKLMKKADMSSQEGKKFAEDLMKRSEKNKDQFEKKLNTKISAALKNMDIARQSDIKRLEKKIESLNKKK